MYRSIRNWLVQLREIKATNLLAILILCALNLIYSPAVLAVEPENSKPLETVNLQLKWLHAFQFAGYYAAKDQGYYADEGLDVNIYEFNQEKPIVQQVISGVSDYGIGDIGILFNYANGEPIKALAAIFQHNALVFISRRSSGILSPYETLGKRIMEEQGATDDAPLRAMLSDADITKEKYTSVMYSYNIEDFILNKVDVMSAYITDQPFAIRKRGVEINIIKPQNYGTDFYGDILFTSNRELEKHPGRAKRFLRASLKGWRYAFEHTEELVQLIKNQYHSQSSIDRLRNEALETKKLVLPDTIPLGQMKVKRLRHVADVYTRLKLSRKLSDSELDDFIYPKEDKVNLNQQEREWLQLHPVIRLGVAKNFVPYEWIDDKGKYHGIAADYIELLEQRLDVKFEVIKDKGSWQDVLEAAKQGELDVLSCLVKTPERESFLNFSQHYLDSSAVIISEQSNGYIGSLKNLEGKRVAIQKSHFTEELLIHNFPTIEIISTTTIEEALRMVSEGQAFAYVGDVTAASYAMKKEGFLNLIFSGSTPYQSQFSIATHKNKPVLASIINKAMATISQDERDDIYNHWRSFTITKGVDVEVIFKYALIIAVLFLLFLYWIYRLRQSENALRVSEAKLQLILDTNPECVKVLSADGRLLQMNPSGLKLIEADDATQVIGGKIDELVMEEYRQAFNEMIEQVLKGEPSNLEFQIKGLKGTIRWVEAHSVPLLNEKNNIISILSVCRDMTEKKQAEKIIWEQANYDPLTRLPNRYMLLDRLRQDIKTALRSDKTLALIFLDLDHFKEVNDTLGHYRGDELLCQAAQRLISCLRGADTVARLGGDEFVIILPDLDEIHSIDRVAQNIIQSLSQVFILGEDRAYVSASLGIALYPSDSNDADGLVRNADQAMYLSKENGRGRFSYFTQSMQEKAQFRMLLLLDLREALEKKQFELYYQPIVNLTSGSIIKAEALIRWNHPARGIIGPDDFIPLAEDSGLINEIGDWVFKEATKQVKLWCDLYNNDLQVSVNKSPAQFRVSINSDDWLNHLKDIGLSGDSVVIEITEGLLMENTSYISEQLLQFRDAGIQVSMDDFGTGYSALSYLNKFDIDYLKIDHSFTRNLAKGSNDMVLSEAIILMSHKLGLKVIAEGIETEEQQMLLTEAGCDYGQGYLFSRPVTADEFEALLNVNK